MYKNVSQNALKEASTQFLVSAIRNNCMESITSWVEENLVNESSNTTADKKIAFYEAEKSLIIEYIMENDFSGLQNLMDAIDNKKFVNNQKLKVNECRVLANAIIEKKRYCEEKKSVRKDLHDNLYKLLDTKYNELIDENYRSEISEKITEALSIVTIMGDEGSSGSTDNL
ncbi:MAG: hypothetical protein LF885_06505 [Rickettsia endosymbiont of Culicoides impunctatus]|nr:MAG: hypothetical protein LF885_06505 [Rickettsia endosymbiont of Culicoides impunctatus]